MSNKIVLLFILIFSFLNLIYGRSNNDIISSQNIINYHYYINKAELAICSNDYKSAIKYYNKAFSFHDAPFAIDIYNYVVVSIYENKFSEAFEYSSKLIKLGIQLNFFNQKPFNRLKSDKNGWNKFLHNYPQLVKEYRNKIDTTLRNTLILLHDLDQDRYCKKTRMFNIIDINPDTAFNGLLNILKSQGYPDEYTIGVFVENDTILNEAPCDVIIRHLYQDRYGNLNDLKKILIESIQKGKLDPYKFMTWDEFYYQPYHFYGVECIEKNGGSLYLPQENFENFNVDFFNQNRMNIGAYSLSDEIIKLLYQYQNPGLKFKVDQSIIVLPNSKINEKYYKKLEKINNNEKINLMCLKNNSTSKKSNYKNYYRYVNEAELKICNNDFNSASKFYQKAFKKIKFPFPRDIYNALLINIKLKNNLNSYKLSRELIKYGVDLKFFDQETLKELKHNTIEWDDLKKDFIKLKQEHDSLFNKDIIIELKDISSSFKSIYYDYKWETDSHINESLNGLYDRLFELINEQRYPGHQIVGVLTVQDTILIDAPTEILRSYFYSNQYDELFLGKLYKEILNGNLLPKNYLKILNQAYAIEDEYWFPLIAYKNNSEIYILNKENEIVNKRIKGYNKLRKQIFCFNYQDEIQKMIFKFKNKNSKFDFKHIYWSIKIENIRPYQETNTYQKIDLNDY